MESLARWSNALHGLVALGAVWLFASSPWLAMFAELPEPAGWANLAHVGVGLALLPLALAYAAAVLAAGWRLYFPWLAGDWAQIGRDLAGLARFERPMSEGGGLFGAIEGLLLVALIATAASGAAWLLMQGSEAVFEVWRWHRIAARACGALAVLHLTAVALHLVDLIRN